MVEEEDDLLDDNNRKHISMENYETVNLFDKQSQDDS